VPFGGVAALILPSVSLTFPFGKFARASGGSLRCATRCLAGLSAGQSSESLVC
jgi:hypothetical protein